MKKIKKIRRTKQILKLGVVLKEDKLNKKSPTKHILWTEEMALAEGMKSEKADTHTARKDMKPSMLRRIPVSKREQMLKHKNLRRK